MPMGKWGKFFSKTVESNGNKFELVWRNWTPDSFAQASQYRWKGIFFFHFTIRLSAFGRSSCCLIWNSRFSWQLFFHPNKSNALFDHWKLAKKTNATIVTKFDFLFFYSIINWEINPNFICYCANFKFKSLMIKWYNCLKNRHYHLLIHLMSDFNILNDDLVSKINLKCAWQLRVCTIVHLKMLLRELFDLIVISNCNLPVNKKNQTDFEFRICH